jgi:hypothetical protein
MAWDVEAYCEEEAGQRVRVVEDEALALLDDPRVRFDAAKVVGWLHAVAKGTALPTREPESSFDGWTCRYRTDGEVVVIFAQVGPDRLLILRFGQAASAFPVVGDLRLAAQRMQAWSQRHGE